MRTGQGNAWGTSSLSSGSGLSLPRSSLSLLGVLALLPSEHRRRLACWTQRLSSSSPRLALSPEP